MSSMQPNQLGNEQDIAEQGQHGSQFFPPYQAPDGQPQPFMGTVDPSLPSPQTPAYQPMMTTSIPKQHNRPVFLIVSLVLSILIALGAGGFGLWAYGQRQDYKDNSDKKVTAAVEVAVKNESERKDAEFVDKEKQPYKTYKSSDVTGVVKITYPKTWSGYVSEDNTSKPLDAYWHPDIVPGLQSKTAYALRLEVTNRTYEEELRAFDPQVKGGKATVSPYVPKNVTGVTGARVVGEVNPGQKVTMIVLPLRDKTIKISTESPDFVGDLENIVLANLTFTP